MLGGKIACFKEIFNPELEITSSLKPTESMKLAFTVKFFPISSFFIT